MRVWIDRDRCTGDAQCADTCPEVFTMHDDGRTYRAYVCGAGAPTRDADAVVVPVHLEGAVVEATEECPGECIMLEP
jgi:ferredoxin